MSLKKFIPIGSTYKPFGLKGELKFGIEDAYWEDFEAMTTIFIGKEGDKPSPYFIESIRGADDSILKLEDVNSPEEAKKIASQTIYARERDLSAVLDERTAYEKLEGYKIHDAHIGEIGIIEAVEEMQYQSLASVPKGKKTVYIPLHPQFVIKIDTTEKIVFMDLPDGIMDL